MCVSICAQVTWLGKKEINVNNGFQKYANAILNLCRSFL